MAKATTKLTKAKLDKLRQQAAGDSSFAAYVGDAGQPGLYAWARRGRVRFVFQYTSPTNGSRRRLSIDDYGAITLEAARNIASGHRADVAAGVDPHVVREEQERLSVTIAEAAKGYLADLDARAKTGARRGKRGSHAGMKRLLTVNALPKLGSTRLLDLTPEKVRGLHRSMSSTPVEANRTLTALSAVYGWADRAQLVPSGTNPTRHVERFAERGTRRAFAATELQALGEALNEADAAGTEHPSAILAIRLLALTGFRRSEVLGQAMKDRRGPRDGLRWGDIDLEGGLIHLHDTKTGRQTRTIGTAAVELLEKAGPARPKRDDLVCPGDKDGQAFVGIDKVRLRLWRAASLEGVDLHSLRHTFASIGVHVQNGRFAAQVSALLGHGYQSKAITERYITSNPAALRPAADAIADELARLLGLTEPGRVVEFRTLATGPRF